MPADFNTPINSTAYATVLSALKERDTDALTLCYAGDPSNIPTGAIKYNRASNKLQQWDGTAWVDLVLALAGGGIGVTSIASLKSALGYGDMAGQTSSAVAITGGTITGINFNASVITAGLIAQARLGTGSGGAGLKVLYDDQTYKDAEPVGTGKLWFTNTPPSGYLICDGTAISRTTYAALFAIIGSIWGNGDGSTTFNLPDLRQKFPMGKAASGTGATLAGTGGAIDHTHTYTQVPNHIHTIGVAITDPGHDHTVHGIPGASVGIAAGTDAIAVEQGGYISPGTATTGISASATCSNPTSGVATGTTAANNPPFVVVNFIIKY